jgi:hypothetical protein
MVVLPAEGRAFANQHHRSARQLQRFSVADVLRQMRARAVNAVRSTAAHGMLDVAGVIGLGDGFGRRDVSQEASGHGRSNQA